jgi:hypothetical protein
MFADKYKRWLDAGCPVGTPPSIVRSCNETSQNHGLQMTICDLKADVEALKKELASVKEYVAVMKSFGLAVIILIIVVLAALVKLFDSGNVSWQ